MALSTSRVVQVGETAYAHEREAIEFVIQSLPNTDPFQLWGLVDLLEPSTGRLYEIDLLVIGYSALYLIEIKSGPGRYDGDSVDWWRTAPGEAQRWMEAPLRLANHKAKVLKSRLTSKLDERAPWVEPLVFLSNPDAQIHLRPEGRVRVVNRSEVARAITHHEFTGAQTGWQHKRIDTPLVRDIAQAFAAIGIRPRKGKMFVGAYELGAMLSEGPGFQDRIAVHRENPRMRRRARVYLVPQQTSIERRQQVRRAADREAQLLWDVREHPAVLTCTDYVSDAAVGPTVLLDDFPEAQPLASFLRSTPTPSFAERVAILEQIGRALAFCHRKSVHHGALSPDAVLVRRNPESAVIEARLFNFQLGGSAEVEATSHLTSLVTESGLIYRAPELREFHEDLSPVTDMFSLGALAYFIFTERPPAERVADLDARLSRERCLDPRVVSDDIHPAIADLICEATRLAPAERMDDVAVWIETLLLEARDDSARKPDQDPLEAGKGDILGTDLLVIGVLGHGATSRVLKVERDSKEYALKISLSEDHDKRITEEGRILQRLRHPRIIQLIETITLGGRSCLLLSLAGESSLHTLIAREGSLPLDFAIRWGEDLLSALEYLEDEEVRIIHRDIKPANLGVRAVAKEARRLTLFDFSLAGQSTTDVNVGTSAYRDPYLNERGGWDGAADRWSAAVTLHEMLTGTRPRFGQALSDTQLTGRHGSALDPNATLLLAAERFEPSVRDRLVGFFNRALARESEHRFGSAKEMSLGWTACFDARLILADARPSDSLSEGTTPEIDDVQLAAISSETPVGALPLTPRARNALDRAGLTNAGALRTLVDNRLSAIRGIGSAVAKEILRFRTRWLQAQAETPSEPKPFYPGYKGEDLALRIAGVSPTSVAIFEDAGIVSLRGLAESPGDQIESLAKRAGSASDSLRKLLDEQNQKADEREHPTTVEGWVDALLLARKSAAKYFRLLFGLEAPFSGRVDVSPAEVAEVADVTPPAIYIHLNKAREAWRKHPGFDELARLCHGLVETTGGAAPLDRLADEVRALLPHDRTAPEALVRARAAMLVRAVTEVEKEHLGGLRFVRLRDEAPWVFASDLHKDVVSKLGDGADDLAVRSVLASPGEVARVLTDAVAGTPLAGLPSDRLAALAASASRKAALSARLEIYPRDMAPARALDLCAAVLGGRVTETELRDRILARYPGVDLPPRPTLDRLMADLKPQGFRWNDASGVFERPGAAPGGSLHTIFGSSSTRVPTALPHQVRSFAPEALAARDFDERLRAALERKSFRLLGVTADKAASAAVLLGKELKMNVVSLDRVVIAEATALAKETGVPLPLIHETDRLGTEGEEWESLRNLMEQASARVAAKLIPAREPLLLVQPGLIERYGLVRFLSQIVEGAKRDDCAAVLLMIPARDTGGVPTINGRLPVPGLVPGQSLWIPREWLANRHGAAA
jgi:serine/threonine protein kinase